MNTTLSEILTKIKEVFASTMEIVKSSNALEIAATVAITAAALVGTYFLMQI